MAIKIENRLFQIETEHTSYQMKVDKYGVLTHLWYGAKTECSMDYLLDYPDVGFSGNIYEAENQRTYSLNTLPQEYSTSGVGDFRIPAITVTHDDGSRALDLRYSGHKISRGKYNIDGLPAVYATEEEAETLEIVMEDTATNIEVILMYGVLPKKDIITRSTVIINNGTTPITINKAHSLCLDLPEGDWQSIHFHGRHAMERQMERCELIHGIEEFSSSRGTSSHQQNPTILLCEKECTETSGFCVGAALMYSGGFQTQIEKDQLKQVRVVMGINPETFSWKLNASERFNTPEVILSCSMEGTAKLSQQFHKIIRHNVCRGKYQLSQRPILINNWEATYFDFDEKKILDIAKEASKIGIDMFVLDDGWFGKRDSDNSGLGDWYVNENKIKGGLANLISKINDLGMKFGIWFEPEMVSEDSDLYREHPEWAIKIPGRNPMRSRYQLVLDMSNPEVIEYLYNSISDILKNNNIEYVKWDMNRSISDWYSTCLPSSRQGEQPHRYILGLYELLERLITDFPHILFEGCSGGGGRFDAGMLYYSPQIWCSDNTDAHERTFIQYGTSFFYPISTVGSHVSAVPNHQTGRITSLDTRGIVAMAGSFGYELDLSTLTEEEKETMKEQVKKYRQYQLLIHNGDYYRLTNPHNSRIAAWQWNDNTNGNVLVQGVVFRAVANMVRDKIKLMGVDALAKYKLKGTGEIYSGMALMTGGILIPRTTGDDAAFELFFEKLANDEEK